MPVVRLRKLPDKDYLSEVFDYNSITGILIWRERPRDHFSSLVRKDTWNRMYAGRDAGNISLYGLRSSFDNQTWENHYIIWKLVYNTEPTKIFHRNKIQCDNALENLYEEDNNRKTDYIRYVPGTPIGISELKRGGFKLYAVDAPPFIFTYHSTLEQAQVTALSLREKLGV